jgi:sporulation inhibitor KapD
VKDFLVVDFEFTQYTSRVGRPRGFYSEIIEIGAVKIDGDSLQEVGEIHAFVRPHFSYRQLKDIMEFCLISEADMKTAIPFTDMIERIRSLYVPGQTYFASWGDADFLILEDGCKRNGINNPVAEADVLDMAAWYKWEMGDNNTTSLRNAIDEQNVEVGVLWHTAIGDAKNTKELLVQLLSDGWDPEEFVV